ncbi:unnamed protein product [Peronospora farinosa]|uniref:Uncharacterized protein n=1 Tax=Peronospora farinosa TaxID=134698 RepID=A0ABN8CHD0_9STRA|nr:unnamed protein product [Peronospora farinosa]
MFEDVCLANTCALGKSAAAALSFPQRVRGDVYPKVAMFAPPNEALVAVTGVVESRARFPIRGVLLTLLLSVPVAGEAQVSGLVLGKLRTMMHSELQICVKVRKGYSVNLEWGFLNLCMSQCTTSTIAQAFLLSNIGMNYG